MKASYIIPTLLLLLISIQHLSIAQTPSEYEAAVTFPANYQPGDYIEFLRVTPLGAGSSGYYEVSITYTRMNVAASATFIASMTHANPNVWREVGRVNSNGYALHGSDGHNFTVDCNTESGNPRFRIRAIATLGTTSQTLPVLIKVRSINRNLTWTPLSATGNDLTVDKMLPMTNDWSLYVGNTFQNQGANLAIKATINGNVGIGIATPTEKLAVNGNIRAKEIKVEMANWPDYVFSDDYQLPGLEETEAYIKTHRRLPGMPSAEEAEVNGVSLGEMNRKLLEKVEELTLLLIKQNSRLEEMEKTVKQRRTPVASKLPDGRKP